jgi:hypothetical protein
MSSTLRISESLYRVVAQEAAARQRSPDACAEEVLISILLSL